MSENRDGAKSTDNKEILDKLTDSERERLEKRIRFEKMAEEIYELAEKHGLSLAEVSASCGYSRYSLTSMISQTKTTGRLNMPVVEAALEFLKKLDKSHE